MRRFNSYRVVAMSLTAVSLSGCSYNKISGQDQAIKVEWAQVQNELQRRNDLIPPLVDALKSYAPHERSLLQSAVDSRTRLAAARTPAETIQAANEQSTALARLLAVVENYPPLKANDSFNRLTEELAGTEIRIAVERMRYNAFVQQYNLSRRHMTGALTALLFNFHDYPFFEVPAVPATPHEAPKS